MGENKRKEKSVDISSEIGEKETTTSEGDEQMGKKPRRNKSSKAGVEIKDNIEQTDVKKTKKKKSSNRIVNDDQGDTEKVPRRKKSSKIEKSSQECATVNQVATESIDARVE